jgi:hypothetical protein
VCKVIPVPPIVSVVCREAKTLGNAKGKALGSGVLCVMIRRKKLSRNEGQVDLNNVKRTNSTSRKIAGSNADEVIEFLSI